MMKNISIAGSLLVFLAGCATPTTESSEDLLKTAESGDANAAYKLGNMYFYGEGVEFSNSRAFKYVSLAAKAGLADAQIRRAEMLYKGQGTGQEFFAAGFWLAIGLLNKPDNNRKEKRLMNRITHELHPKDVKLLASVFEICAAEPHVTPFGATFNCPAIGEKVERLIEDSQVRPKRRAIGLVDVDPWFKKVMTGEHFKEF